MHTEIILLYLIIEESVLSLFTFTLKPTHRDAQNKLVVFVIAFRKFEENKIVVLGISVDSKESIKEFIDDHNLNFPLLSDENKEVSKAYGVLNNIGIDSRITFIIDKKGNIASILRDVDVETHADDVYKIA